MADVQNIGDFSTVITAGGATGAVFVLSLIARLAWRQLSRDSLVSTKETVENNLYKNLQEELNRMRDELNRMNEEIRQTKDDHRNEIDALKVEHMNALKELEERHNAEKLTQDRQMAALQRSWEIVRKKNESMRAKALDAYSYLSTTEAGCGFKCSQEIKDTILAIAIQGEDNGEA